MPDGRAALIGGRRRVSRAGGSDLVAFSALALELAEPADRLGSLTSLLLRRLFVVTAHPHLAIQPFALHLLFQRAERLIDVVVANLDFHRPQAPRCFTTSRPDS